VLDNLVLDNLGPVLVVDNLERAVDNQVRVVGIGDIEEVVGIADMAVEDIDFG
jgi:hypothetical protein